ncbi:MAG: UbiA family prenyltransferase, partial [Myxococcales bacterium]|nr:UbiA family prenyltransferase [Myxococcales bacterium]
MSKQTLHDLWALTKPRIVYLNVFMTALGLWLAPGETSWVVMVLALLGCALAVASANALNMYFERDFDRLMARTKKRPLP